MGWCTLILSNVRLIAPGFCCKGMRTCISLLRLCSTQMPTWYRISIHNWIQIQPNQTNPYWTKPDHYWNNGKITANLEIGNVNQAKIKRNRIWKKEANELTMKILALFLTEGYLFQLFLLWCLLFTHFHLCQRQLMFHLSPHISSAPSMFGHFVHR